MKLGYELRDPSHTDAVCRHWYSSIAKLLLSMYETLGSSHGATDQRICLMTDS